MRAAELTLTGFSLLNSLAAGQSGASPVGVATVGGVEIAYRFTPVPDGAQRFYASAAYRNSDVVRAPDLPAYSLRTPGLVPQIAGISTGSGTGDPIGDFAFNSQWTGYQPGMAIAAKRDIFATRNGDIYTDELFTADPGTTQPNLAFTSNFTFTGGTRSYQSVSGSATSVAKQVGDGVRSAFVACGWINGIR